MKIFGIDVSAFKLQRNETLVSIDTVLEKDIPKAVVSLPVKGKEDQKLSNRIIDSTDMQFYKRPFNNSEKLGPLRSQFVVPKAPGLDNTELKKRVTPLLNIKPQIGNRRANGNSFSSIHEIKDPKNNSAPHANTFTRKRVNRDALEDVNSRWESMMDMAASSSITLVPENNIKQNHKSKRSISFNETVTMHKISRIQDLIEEYDAFEEMNIEFGQDEWNSDAVEDTDLFQDKNEDLLDLTLKDLNQDYITSEKITRKPVPKQISDDEESVTSLRPGCPTPDRLTYPELNSESLGFERKTLSQAVPYHLYGSPLRPTMESDHLRELEILFENHRYRNKEPITPIVSLSLSEETLEPEILEHEVKEFEWKPISQWFGFKKQSWTKSKFGLVEAIKKFLNWKPDGKVVPV
ncbi:hypothetical protein HDV04_002865 [Boothiomyces sp. JEL0838]|nr:hypothetical protein HDV04_002865 [Boothiomyces sp. JEL0838]